MKLDSEIDNNKLFKRSVFSVIVLSLFTLIITVVIVFSIKILKNIKRDITCLESRMKQISDGQLDIDIPTDLTKNFTSLTESLNQMKKQLQDDAEYRSRFIMGVSHDLKTPLSSIDGYIEAMLEGFADTQEKQTKFLNIMKDKSKILTRRILSLIDYARLNNLYSRDRLRDVNLKQFIDELLTMYNSDLEQHMFKLIVHDLPELDFNIKMDETSIYRVFENLFHNAIRYSKERKEIIFDIEKNNSYLLIKIGNYGQGIKKQNLNKIFEPLFRESSGRNEEGSGLGLTSVKYITDCHGWQIYAESEIDKLTTFTIKVPFG